MCPVPLAFHLSHDYIFSIYSMFNGKEGTIEFCVASLIALQENVICLGNSC